MEIDQLIEKLRKQLQQIDQGDAEVWFNTSYTILLDYFPSFSQRATNFHSLITDFRFKKIYGITPLQVKDLKSKATEYLNETILYLVDLKEQQKQESIKKAEILKKMSQSKPTPIPPPPAKVNDPIVTTVTKTQLPFNIDLSLFWIIFVAIVTAAFFLGLYFGTAKFDKEKSDYYDQVKSLKMDTTRLNRLVLDADYISKQKDSTILKFRDSLDIAKKDIDKLYLYIGSLKK